MTNEPLIELTGVNVAHHEANDMVLIREVNWKIGRGEFWIVGSGTGGISSLLTTAAGLNRPKSGTVRLGMYDATTATDAERIEWRQRVGFVFEGGGRLLSTLTVAENIALPLEYNTTTSEADIRSHVGKWLERIGLTAHTDAPASRLAPRWQQRAGLARALVSPKEILFVDRPAAGRGTHDARWWYDALREQHAHGVTVVVGSNDFVTWLDLADCFALVRNEQFFPLGSREQLLTNNDETLRELLMVN